MVPYHQDRRRPLSSTTSLDMNLSSSSSQRPTPSTSNAFLALHMSPSLFLACFFFLLTSITTTGMVRADAAAAAKSYPQPALDAPQVIRDLWRVMVPQQEKAAAAPLKEVPPLSSTHREEWARGWQPVPEVGASLGDSEQQPDAKSFYHRGSSDVNFWVPPTHKVGSLLTAMTSSPRIPPSGPCPWCFTSFGCWGGKAIQRQRSVGVQLAETVDQLEDTLKCASGSSEEETSSTTSEQSRKSVVKFHIAAGDNFYERGVSNEKDAQFRDKFEKSYPQSALMRLPWLIALGNHDYRQNFFAQVSYSQAPPTAMTASTAVKGSSSSSTVMSSGRWFLPFPYYSARVDPQLLVVTLDCPLLERCHNNGPASARCWDGGAQKRWFEELMATVEASEMAGEEGGEQLLKFRVLQCHYPMYANGPHVNHKWLIEWLEPLLVKYCFQVYINADNHYLQLAEKNGVAYVNSGGGAGYGRHSPSNKGYIPTLYSKYLAFTDGFFTHCVHTNSTTTLPSSSSSLVSTAYETGTTPDASAKPTFTFVSASISTSQCRRRRGDKTSFSQRTSSKKDVNSLDALSAQQQQQQQLPQFPLASASAYLQQQQQLVNSSGDEFVSGRMTPIASVIMFTFTAVLLMLFWNGRRHNRRRCGGGATAAPPTARFVKE